jgi:hypothetical protein
MRILRHVIQPKMNIWLVKEKTRKHAQILMINLIVSGAKLNWMQISRHAIISQDQISAKIEILKKNVKKLKIWECVFGKEVASIKPQHKSQELM